MAVELEQLIQHEYFQFLIIVISSVILAQIVHFILVNYVRRLAARTKTDIDDIIVNLLTKPVYIFIVFTGLYLALKSLSQLATYFTYLDGIYFVVTVLLIALIVSHILRIVLSFWLKAQKQLEKMPKLLSHIIALFIYLIAFLMILEHFNIEITPLILASGIGALAIALALQNTLSNLFSGLHIVSDRPINFGDYIAVEGGVSGFVEDIGWRSTRIRTLPNTMVIIPNSKLAESIITNYSLPILEMSVVIQCGVDYGSDLEKVERVTIDVAKQVQDTVPGAMKDFQPFIRYHTFDESNINFSIILRVEEPAVQYIVKHEFIKALKKRYDEEGIEISWPIVKIHHADN